MKKLLLITVLLLCTISLTNTQWVSNYGVSSGDVNFTNAKGTAITCDAAGNSYVTGYSYENESQNDIITIKYTPAGDTAWVRSFNGDANLNDEGNGICVDNAGNVYVVGFAEFNGKSKDVVIIKYSSNGTEEWSRAYSGADTPTIDEGLGIVVDASGYIYITGYTTFTDNYTDILVRKYDPSGDLVWSASEDGSSNLNAQGLAIAVGRTGNVYVTGFVTVSGANTDIALFKYNSDGQLQWAKTINGNGSTEDKAWGIVVDESDNIFITGYVTESANNTDAFTAKYHCSGTMMWSKTYNGTGNQSDKAWGIVVDTDGSVYVSGESTADAGNINYLTVKYTAAGTQSWVSEYNGTGNGEDRASAVSILLNSSNTKSVIVTGKSWGPSNTFDYATVRYNTESGIQSQVNRYTFTGNSNDIAKDLVISPSKKVIITGFSQLIIDAGVGSSYVSTQSVDFGETIEMNSELTTPGSFILHQNYPNPFNPATSIRFDLTQSSNVRLAVYDMLGREINVLVNQNLTAGTHNITFNASNLSSGVYFYKLEAGSFRDIKKMTLVK
ncbi:MAG TPA: T9SS type A sorting domain-containing protein [Ignavibacteria bacterium]|nr:hypothetical protein [Bacteroidota bacterium]HRF65836.1 T9SS type A sorting domain-containing protein [Ignavibacteria bacterium]HRJ05825.1 T9SS type A sorting domain-containing protein [Ignavibacteria bacterium]HRJ86806.1 T9SS type A sorting domain-containing protein [Ignavibacteria bacterium]